MNPKLFWKNYRKWILAAIGIIGAGIAIYFAFLRNEALLRAFKQLVKILMPFWVGGSLAYILSPLCNFLDRYLKELLEQICKSRKRAAGWAHSISCLLTLVALFLGVGIFLWLLIPQLYESIVGLVNSVPLYALEVYRKVQPIMEWLGIEGDSTAVDWMTMARNYAQQFLDNWMMDSLADIASGVTKSVTTVASLVVNTLVSVIVSFYCLNSRKKFALQGKKLVYAVFSRQWAEKVLYRLQFANHAFSGFVSGRILDSAIIGCICFVGCSLLKIAYAPLIAVIVGVTNVIPFFGPFIGGVPSAILVLLENPIQALYFVIFIILLQQFDGNILGPHILSSAVGVSSFWVLFSILLFGGLWGVVGMIIGTPLFAIIYDIAKDWVNGRLDKKGLPLEAYKYSGQLSTQFTIDQAEHSEEERE